MDLFIEGKFSNAINPKDGFAISKCKDATTHKVLDFIVPILHPEKPTKVTITIENTIFGVMTKE